MIKQNPMLQKLQSLVDSQATEEKIKMSKELAIFLDDPSQFNTFDYFETLDFLQQSFQNNQENPEIQMVLLDALGKYFSHEKAGILASALNSSNEKVRTKGQYICRTFPNPNIDEDDQQIHSHNGYDQQALTLLMEVSNFNDRLEQATNNLFKIEAQEIEAQEVEQILKTIQEKKNLSYLIREKAKSLQN